MTPLETLLVVQEHDTRGDQLRHRRDTLPERTIISQGQAARRSLDARAGERRTRRAELAANQRRLEDEIAGHEDRVAAAEKALYAGSVTSPRDLRALQDEQASLRRRIGILEEQVLETMEVAEPLDAELSALDAEGASIDDRVEQASLALTAAEAEVEVELATVEKERGELVAIVPTELIAEYEELRRRLGGVGVARLNGRRCGGCHLELAAVELDRIRREGPDVPIHCEECGRLLVR